MRSKTVTETHFEAEKGMVVIDHDATLVIFEPLPHLNSLTKL